MAAGILAAPGSKLGPCEGGCAHVDCKSTKLDAGAACTFCTKAIGYDVRFYRGRAGTGALAHAACLEDAAEKHDTRVSEF